MNWNSTLRRSTKPMKRSPFKRSSRRKSVPASEKRYLDACRGERCYLGILGVCRGDTETVVPAHANSQAYGKGMGIKAKHQFTVPACADCHYELDQGRLFSKAGKRAIWERAYAAWEPVRARKLQAKQNPATVSAVPGLSSHSI